MDTVPVLVERVKDIAVLTLSAPQRRNAISTAMRIELREELRRLAEDDTVHAVVLTGAGDHFCSGGDISEMAPSRESVNPIVGRRRLDIIHDVVRLLIGSPKPIIAAVEGSAFGAGMSLALACDWVIASDSALFAAAFGKIGLIADCGLLWSLPQRIGLSRARDLLLTARSVGAPEALTIGLVDEGVPAGQAMAAAMRKADSYRAVAPLAIAATKEIFMRNPSSLEDLLHVEADAQLLLALSHDHEEARRAFLEKRKPVFSGR